MTSSFSFKTSHNWLDPNLSAQLLLNKAEDIGWWIGKGRYIQRASDFPGKRHTFIFLLDVVKVFEYLYGYDSSQSMQLCLMVNDKLQDNLSIVPA